MEISKYFKKEIIYFVGCTIAIPTFYLQIFLGVYSFPFQLIFVFGLISFHHKISEPDKGLEHQVGEGLTCGTLGLNTEGQKKTNLAGPEPTQGGW